MGLHPGGQTVSQDFYLNPSENLGIPADPEDDFADMGAAFQPPVRLGRLF